LSMLIQPTKLIDPSTQKCGPINWCDFQNFKNIFGVKKNVSHKNNMNQNMFNFQNEEKNVCIAV